MKVKNLLAILLALTFLVIPVSAEENDDLIQPHDMSIASGYLYDSTGFKQTYFLDHRNGPRLFMEVENLGTTEVVCSINGGVSRTIGPGDSATLWYLVLDAWIEEYEFRIVSYQGNMSVRYSIYQRDNNSPVG